MGLVPSPYVVGEGGRLIALHRLQPCPSFLNVRVGRKVSCLVRQKANKCVWCLHFPPSKQIQGCVRHHGSGKVGKGCIRGAQQPFPTFPDEHATAVTVHLYAHPTYTPCEQMHVQ